MAARFDQSGVRDTSCRKLNPFPENKSNDRFAQKVEGRDGRPGFA
jgi:hypothetical protein